MIQKLLNTVTLCLLALFCILAWNTKKEYNSFPIFYDHNGQCTATYAKIFCDSFPITTASAFAVDLTSAGFSVIRNIQLTVSNNATGIGQMPEVSLKAFTLTGLTANIVVPNTSIISILGSGVLLGGAAIAPTSTTGFTLHVMVIGI